MPKSRRNTREPGAPSTGMPGLVAVVIFRGVVVLSLLRKACTRNALQQLPHRSPAATAHYGCAGANDGATDCGSCDGPASPGPPGPVWKPEPGPPPGPRCAPEWTMAW
jgi:hypothetical protein